MAISYQIISAVANTDGTGNLALDVQALDGTTPIPGKHQTILIPYSAFAGLTTLTQYAAAAKAAIAAKPGWDLTSLSAWKAANDQTGTTVAAMVAKVTFPAVIAA